METRTYECQYCRKDYVPKRRGVQKFCSNSCRVRSHQLKNKKPKGTEVTTGNNTKTDKTKIEEMSIAGVANSLGGNLAAQGLISLFTKEENKPATKGDLLKLAASLKRYHQVKNLPPNHLGQIPNFDLYKGEIVYFGLSLSFKN
ncbi:MAG: hypothetical protein WAO74_01470 [Polaribacter sp.]|uniref:hypothetical protein n=1 Tax=Polaribacter sp. TaxID=1920175 RepID=UPI003BAED778